MISIIGFLLVMMIVVFVHEFGHYYVAKSSGIKINEFSIGFGRSIFAKTDRHGTNWKIGWLPLGGYVKMHGDQDPASSSHDKLHGKEREGAFYLQSAFVRFLVVLAGPLANYLLAIVIITCINFVHGKVVVPAVIDVVQENSAAARAGLRSDDVIVEVAGRKVKDFSDLQNIVIISPGIPLEMSILRYGIKEKLTVTPTERPEEYGGTSKFKMGFLGVTAKNNPIEVSMGPLDSLFAATSEVIDISNLTLRTLWQIITGARSVNELYGPVTIAQESGKSMKSGFLYFALFVAMLSVNLGLINLLPVPVLDGGHIVMFGYEMITGKPLNSYFKNILMRIGVGIIVFLIVISVSNDIRSLVF